MITGKTKNLAVIGWPIAHSFSPNIQNAAIQQAGLDYVYTAFPVQPKDLETAVHGLKALNFRGWNITLPHKQAIILFLDEIHEDAKVVGAVNTVVNENGRLLGYNTDVYGFTQALVERGFDLSGKTVALLGAGGAARAVIWGLLKHKVKAIHIGVRNPKKVQPLVDEFRPYGELDVSLWQTEAFDEKLSQADLIVNTTPLGMTPNVDAMPPVDWTRVKEDAFCYDIIYTPQETRFLREAREHGHATLNGEAMLVGQGAAALQKWTGIEPDTECMKLALRQALQSRTL